MSINRIRQKIPHILIIFGIIIMLIGFYYMAVKAGIPYQDPSPELLQKYNYNMNIGAKLCKIGFVTGFVGSNIWLIQILSNKLIHNRLR